MSKITGDRDTERALAAYASLVHAAASVNALLGRQLDSFGLTMGQFRVLEALLHQGPLSPVALSERLVCGSANIACVVSNLQKRGLVVRQEHERDKRSRLVQLTAQGEKLIARVFPLHAHLVRAQMKALRNREQDALQRMCEKLGIGNALKLVRELMIADEDATDES